MGVSMTCPAKLVRPRVLSPRAGLRKTKHALLTGDFAAKVEGEVDQSAGMLDDTAKDKGYVLLCVSEPQSDCKVAVIEEVCNSLCIAASAS